MSEEKAGGRLMAARLSSDRTKPEPYSKSPQKDATSGLQPLKACQLKDCMFSWCVIVSFPSPLTARSVKRRRELCSGVVRLESRYSDLGWEGCLHWGPAYASFGPSVIDMPSAGSAWALGMSSWLQSASTLQV